MTGGVFGTQKTFLPKGKGVTYTECVKDAKDSNSREKIEEAMLTFWNNPYMVSQNTNPDIFGYNQKKIFGKKDAANSKLEPIAECSDPEREDSLGPDDSLS